MDSELSPERTDSASRAAELTVFPILVAISFSHLLNDSLQALIPSLYPVFKDVLRLSFTQVGLITLTTQLAGSLLQPFVGALTDRRPQPYSLAAGMVITLIGLVFLAFAQSYAMLLVSVALIGVGSSIFHPESSRVAYMAAGRRRGLAQSVFQVGGNFGFSLGPLMAVLIIASRGWSQAIWFSPLALVGIAILFWVGRWYQGRVSPKADTAPRRGSRKPPCCPAGESRLQLSSSWS